MRTILAPTLAAVGWLFLALAPNALHAADYGGFFEFTVYTQEGEPAEQYKKNVIVMLHGFKSAMPNDDFRVFHETFAETHTVVGFNYDYVDVAGNVAEFDDLNERFLKDRNLIVVGTSLGGFWADYFANHVQASGLILINPVVDPRDTMRRALGEQYSKKRQASFTVTEETVAAYGNVAPADHPGTRKLVLLSKDDEVLDPRIAADYYSRVQNAKVHFLDSGGHNLPLDEPGTIKTIHDFVRERMQD